MAHSFSLLIYRSSGNTRAPHKSSHPRFWPLVVPSRPTTQAHHTTFFLWSPKRRKRKRWNCKPRTAASKSKPIFLTTLFPVPAFVHLHPPSSTSIIVVIDKTRPIIALAVLLISPSPRPLSPSTLMTVDEVAAAISRLILDNLPPVSNSPSPVAQVTKPRAAEQGEKSPHPDVLPVRCSPRLRRAVGLPPCTGLACWPPRGPTRRGTNRVSFTARVSSAPRRSL